MADWIGRNKSNEIGFSWRSGVERETIGIWMWSEVFTHDFKDGKMAIILMDTQGIFDNKTSFKDCISIFAMSMLLSSVLCFNVMPRIREDDLTNLASKGTDEKPFQKLLFIV